MSIFSYFTLIWNELTGKPRPWERTLQHALDTLKAQRPILQQITGKVTDMAGVIETVQQFADAIDAAATDIAGDIQNLQDQLAAAGTPEEVQALLQPVLDKLNNISGIVISPAKAEAPTSPAGYTTNESSS